MRHRKRITTAISILLHALFLIIVYIFQGAIFPYLRLGGLVPLLLPVAVTGVALYEGCDTGGVFGLFAGILCDVSFNQPVGTFTVVLTAVGLGIGILSDSVILSGFISYYLCCAAVLFFCAFVQMTPIIALPNNIPPYEILMKVSTQTLYTLAVAFPMWFPVRALGRRAEHITPSGRML